MGDSEAGELLELEGRRDVEYKAEIAAQGSPGSGPPRYYADMKPQAIPDWPVWLQLVSRRPRAAPLVARAAREERARVGLTWSAVGAQWEMDERRVVLALLADAAAAERHVEALSALQEFRRREDGWPDAYADRRRPLREEDLQEARLALRVARVAVVYSRELVAAWAKRTAGDWLRLAGFDDGAAGEGGSSGGGKGGSSGGRSGGRLKSIFGCLGSVFRA